MNVAEAIRVANRAHAGQYDKAGELVIRHPLRVMEQVAQRHHGSPAHLIVAVLHDVIEDTPWSLGFADDKAYLIEPVTYRPIYIETEVAVALDSITRNANETYREYIERVGTNNLATAVKLVDLDENLGLFGREPIPDAGQREGLARRYAKAKYYLSQGEWPA